MERRLRKIHKPPWGSRQLLINSAFFSALIICVVVWPPSAVTAFISALRRIFVSPAAVTSPSLMLARDKQLLFCSQIDQSGTPPEAISVPWSPLGNIKEASVSLLLLRGVHGVAAGQSAVFQQYVLADNDIVSQHMRQDGGWEQGEVAQIVTAMQQFARTQRLRPQDVYFIDVGANVGVYTLMLAAYGFNVVAFEPLHINVMALRHSLCANPPLMDRVTLFTKGLGNSSTWCSILTQEHNMADGTLACGPDQQLPEGLRKREEVQVLPLDQVLRDALGGLEGRVGAMKVDVEGFELGVAQGAQQFFDVAKPQLVMMECSDDMMRTATGQPASALFKQMHRLGYAVSKGTFDGERIPPSLFNSWEEPSIVNYWFTRTAA